MEGRKSRELTKKKNGGLAVPTHPSCSRKGEGGRAEEGGTSIVRRTRETFERQSSRASGGRRNEGRRKGKGEKEIPTTTTGRGGGTASPRYLGKKKDPLGS